MTIMLQFAHLDCKIEYSSLDSILQYAPNTLPIFHQYFFPVLPADITLRVLVITLKENSTNITHKGLFTTSPHPVKTVV